MKDVEGSSLHALYSLSLGTEGTLEGFAYNPSVINHQPLRTELRVHLQFHGRVWCPERYKVAEG